MSRSSLLQAENHDAGGSFALRIDAEATPETFGRLANVFAITAIVPERVLVKRIAPNLLRFYVEAKADGRRADLMQRKILQMTCVIDVEPRFPPESPGSDPRF